MTGCSNSPLLTGRHSWTTGRRPAFAKAGGEAMLKDGQRGANLPARGHRYRISRCVSVRNSKTRTDLGRFRNCHIKTADLRIDGQAPSSLVDFSLSVFSLHF